MGLSDSQVLRRIRMEYGYTQRELAEMCHVSVRSWQLWEAGERRISPATYELLLIKLGLHQDFVPIAKTKAR
jgi:transcriptional regulator with XRE-family HTH domain